MAYLACQDNPVEQTVLAELFYPQSTTQLARAAISNMMLRLRKAIGKQYILGDYHTVSLAWKLGVTVDVKTFRDKLKRLAIDWTANSEENTTVIAQGADTLMLYQEQFANEAFVPESIKLEAWLTYQREESSNLFREWSLRLARLWLAQQKNKRSLDVEQMIIQYENKVFVGIRPFIGSIFGRGSGGCREFSIAGNV